ncbi:asparagine synthase [Flammeovirgaceae bacterium 311]|nr:asparagine synthase [Flammeovirgaceae bacterium 311]
MCGIGGAINYKRREILTETIQGIGQCIEHRGPDDFGFYFSASGEKALTRDIREGFDFNVALLHRRLSILDLSERGWQPMQTHDKRYTISFNGEVYNYVELRNILVKKGHRFVTETDTEVILYAYKEWGVACLPHFNGMFAFAIHDAVTNDIFIARDPFGIKPLYYVQNENFFLFCSEIKGLLVEPKLQRTVNYSRLKEYLKYGWVNQNTETIFREIKQIPAAHYAIISANSYSPIETKPYWEIQPTEKTDLSFDDAVARVREILYNNIKIHLRSDVEVGYTLSGGIDSSSVIGVANDIFQQSKKFSFSYIPNYEEKSERKWIDIVNARVQAQPHFTQPSEATFISEIERIIGLQDEPFGSTSIYAQYKVFELVKQNNIKVVLDGQGADEIFAGYPIFFSERALTILKKQGIAKYFDFIKRIDPALNFSKQKQIFKTLYKYLPAQLQAEVEKRYYAHTSRLLDKDLFNVEEAKFDASLFRDNFMKGSLYKALRHNDLPSMLRYQDRNSMIFSVEGRVPFLTKDLVEFVYSLPEEYILPNEGYTKKLLREAMKDFLPVEILNRKDKIGFETPEKKWIKNSSDWTFDILNLARKEQGINIEMLKKEFQEVFDHKREYTVVHWRYLNFIKWADMNKVV